MAQSVEQSNRKVMRQVLSLPVVLGALLIITGTVGIFSAKQSQKQLIKINDAALGPALAFDEISTTLVQFSQNLLRLNQKFLSASEEADLLKRVSKSYKKAKRLIKAQAAGAKGQVYENYFGKWLAEWSKFEIQVEPLLLDEKSLKRKIDSIDKATSDLAEKIENINSFIQSDVKDMLDQSKTFSTEATALLVAILVLGVFLGGLASALIVQSIRQLFIEIAVGKKDIETLLNNLDQGFLVFDRHGHIQKGASKAADKLFGVNPEGKSFGDLFDCEKIDRNFLAQWYEMLWSGSLSFSDLAPLAPKSFERDGRYVELAYRPISSEVYPVRLEKVICIASDKTEERQLRERAESEAALVKMVIRVLRDRSGFVDFVFETRRVFSDLFEELEKSEPKMDSLFRYMHSIKGGAAAFYILNVSEQAHCLENKLVDLKDQEPESLSAYLPKLREGAKGLSGNFEKYLKDHEYIVGKLDRNEDRTKSISVKALHDMGQIILKHAGQESPAFKFFNERFVQEDAAAAFEKYEAVVKGIAGRQMKEVDFRVETGKVRVCMEPYQSLFGAYIHAFRNAIDHGIESTDDRVAIGKPPQGAIEVKFEVKPDEVVSRDQFLLRIVVEDDGKGIDCEIVRQKAIEKNLIAAEQAEKMSEFEISNLVFASGFSTKDAVTDLSGRGVGLDALRHEAQKLGGKAWLESVKGKGTKIIVEVPLYDMPFARSLLKAA